MRAYQLHREIVVRLRVRLQDKIARPLDPPRELRLQRRRPVHLQSPHPARRPRDLALLDRRPRHIPHMPVPRLPLHRRRVDRHRVRHRIRRISRRRQRQHRIALAVRAPARIQALQQPVLRARELGRDHLPQLRGALDSDAPPPTPSRSSADDGNPHTRSGERIGVAAVCSSPTALSTAAAAVFGAPSGRLGGAYFARFGCALGREDRDHIAIAVLTSPNRAESPPPCSSRSRPRLRARAAAQSPHPGFPTRHFEHQWRHAANVFRVHIRAPLRSICPPFSGATVSRRGGVAESNPMS